MGNNTVTYQNFIRGYRGEATSVGRRLLPFP